eukprot:261181-Amphidinium_carterae.2
MTIALVVLILVGWVLEHLRQAVGPVVVACNVGARAAYTVVCMLVGVARAPGTTTPGDQTDDLREYQGPHYAGGPSTETLRQFKPEGTHVLLREEIRDVWSEWRAGREPSTATD